MAAMTSPDTVSLRRTDTKPQMPMAHNDSDAAVEPAARLSPSNQLRRTISWPMLSTRGFRCRTLSRSALAALSEAMSRWRRSRA